MIQSASATASHLGLAEIGCDHVSHEQPGGNNECATVYKPTALEFPIRFQLGLHLNDQTIIQRIGGFGGGPFGQHHQDP